MTFLNIFFCAWDALCLSKNDPFYVFLPRVMWAKSWDVILRVLLVV